MTDLPAEYLQRLVDAGFAPHLAPGRLCPSELAGPSRDSIRAILTNGSTGVSAEQIGSLTGLEIICAIGAGCEKIDIEAARARGIIVTSGPGTNDVAVADHAMMLMLAAARGVITADAAARHGEWTRAKAPRPTISGKRLGVIGLGRIGTQIALRGFRGFGMPIGYHSRTRHTRRDWTYFSTPIGVADWCDFLVLATPGGSATKHLVDAEVLDALGPDGYVINIARGSVIDTAALVNALQQHRIAGAALDVVEGEPHVPAELTALPNVTITPHIAGRSPEADRARIELVIRNLTAHFSGHPPLTPVPQSA